jgi:hypothetical protein
MDACIPAPDAAHPVGASPANPGALRGFFISRSARTVVAPGSTRSPPGEPENAGVNRIAVAAPDALPDDMRRRILDVQEKPG